MRTSKTSKKEITFQISEFVYTDSRKVAEQFEKEKYPKFYTLFIRTFSPRDEIEKVVSKMELDEYAYIEHDKDLKEDGSPKKPHFHILLYRKLGFRLTPLIKAFTQNTLIQVCISKKKSFEYLTHKNDKDKAQYSSSLITQYHRDDVDTFSVTAEEARANQYEQMLDDIEQLTRREMGVKYGRDYMLNFERYEKFSSIVRDEDERRQSEEVIFTLNTQLLLTDEVRCVDSVSGDLLRLSYADIIVREFVEAIRNKTSFPSEKEILALYRDLLFKINQARKNQRYIELEFNSPIPVAYASLDLSDRIGGVN